MQEMMYDVLFSVLDVTATKKKPSKNFRNQNTLVLLGLQQKKNSLKIRHPELCCEKPLEIKYTKSVGSAKNSWKPSHLLLVEYARRHFGTKHLLLLELQTRLWNQAPTFVWYANKPKKNTWRSSKALTPVGYAKEHLKTKHLLSVGYAKTTPHFENPALTSSVGYAKKKKKLKIKHLLLLLGMPETPETHNNLRQLGYLFLQQLPKQTNKQSFNTNRKQKSLSLCCSLHTFCVI